MIAERPVREAIRLCDAQKEESEYLETKFPEQVQFIDIEARHVFHQGFSSSLIKCAYGVNHYAMREVVINQDVYNCYCLRCDQLETWEHVIKCSKAINLKNEYINKLRKKLKSQDKNNLEGGKIARILTDIYNYIYNHQVQPTTNQRRLGLRNIFRGIVVNE